MHAPQTYRDAHMPDKPVPPPVQLVPVWTGSLDRDGRAVLVDHAGWVQRPPARRKDEEA